MTVKLPPRRLWTAGSQAAQLPVARPAPVYKCPICNDAGWVVDPTRDLNNRSGNAVPCICNTRAAQKRQERLLAMGGQRGDESAVRLADLRRGPYNEQAIAAAEKLIAAGHGALTLTGLPGRGKSRLLHALVNEMRDRGVETQYTLTTVLLDYLRAAFDPEHEAREFDARWQALIDIPVLCIDELDEYTATDWATIRFKMLLDFRWRDLGSKITAFAVNLRPGQTLEQTRLPEKVVSRLSDGRGRVVAVYGGDLRMQRCETK